VCARRCSARRIRPRRGEHVEIYVAIVDPAGKTGRVYLFIYSSYTRARARVYTAEYLLPIDRRAQLRVLVIGNARKTCGAVASSISLASRVSPGDESLLGRFPLVSPRQPSPVDGSRHETWLSLGITSGTTVGGNGSLPRLNGHPRPVFRFLLTLVPPCRSGLIYPPFPRTRGDQTTRVLFLFSPRLALVIAHTHAHVCIPRARRKRRIKRAEQSDATTERDRGALDQRPSRGSSIAATKRGRTRPLVFIRVPPGMSLSLSRRIPHPVIAMNACTDRRGYAQEISILLLSSRCWTRKSPAPMALRLLDLLIRPRQFERSVKIP